MFTRYATCTWLILLLVGCSPSPFQETRSTDGAATIKVSPSSPLVTTTSPLAHTSTPTHEESATPDQPTPSASPSPTAPVLLETRCLELSDGLLPGTNVRGMLVFESPSQSNIYFGRLMNIQTGEVIELPQGKDEHVFNLQVSVDGKWLAYEKGKGYFPPPDFQIIISGADGRTQITVDSEPSWSGFERWLGENLLIEQRGEDHETLIVFNPFTGQKQSFFAGDYPQIYDAFPLIYGGFQPPLVVNPSLSLLVYPGYRDNGSGAILWDITMNQEITLLPTYGVQSKPEWSPDGIQVAIAKALTDTTGDIPGDQELFSLDRNGAPNRLTFLTEYYDRVEFGQFSWSPDGRYIAFGLVAEPFQSPDLYPQDNPEEFARLAVLDTQTHIVTNYCIPMYYGWKTPIWSPDSRQILVEDITLAGKSRVYLVDPPQGFAARIAEDVSPKGWMVSLEK